MAKTHDDEEYEAGVSEGQRGGFLDDLAHGMVKDNSPRSKGYEYGAEHRYGSEGRYHTWSGSGANDPKSNETSKSEKSDDLSSRDYGSDRASDYGDRHYHGYDVGVSGGKISEAIGKVIGYGFLTLLFSSLIMGGSAGIKNYVKNKTLQPKFKVAQEHNLQPYNLVDKVKLGNTSLIKKLFDSDFDETRLAEKNNSILSLQRKVNHGQLEIEIKNNLVELAGIMLDMGAGRVEFKGYFQEENNVWTVGKYSRNNCGFICYSPDKGETWFNQWKNNGCTNEFPTEIYFFDKNNGWSITTRRILRTLNGGENWETVHVFEDGKLRQFHILNRNILVAQEEVIVSKADRIRQGINGRPFEALDQVFMMLPEVRNQKKTPYKRTVYTSDGGRTWQTIEDWSPELFNLNNLSYTKLDKPIPDYISSTQKQMMEREPKVYFYSETKLRI